MSKLNKPLEIRIVDDFKDFDNFPEDYSGKYLVMNCQIGGLDRNNEIGTSILILTSLHTDKSNLSKDKG